MKIDILENQLFLFNLTKPDEIVFPLSSRHSCKEKNKQKVVSKLMNTFFITQRALNIAHTFTIKRTICFIPPQRNP